MLKSCANEDGYREAVRLSAEQPVILFKHSSRCPISAAARREMTRFSEAHPEADCREVLVIEQRLLSLHIAEETGVAHQSPQAILLRDGRAAWHASHRAITAAALAAAYVEHGG